MSDTNNPNSKVNPQDELRDLIQILPQEECGVDPDYSVLDHEHDLNSCGDNPTVDYWADLVNYDPDNE